MKEIIDVRQPIVEGLFYPDNKKETNKKVKDFLDNNPVPVSYAKHIVVPHGGWDFVGDYIAAGFNSLSKKAYKKVIVISNVHREFTDQIILSGYKSFLINGKEIKVDRDITKKIKSIGNKVTTSNIPHMEEHGIETVLPFVTYLYPEAQIIPVLLGKNIVSLVRSLKNIIEGIANEETLIVVTSNFSDYRRVDEAKELGEKSIELIKGGKLSELVEETRTNRLKTCGAGAIGSLILLKDYSQIEIIKSGMSKGTPLSGGKGTYYGTIGFLE